MTGLPQPEQKRRDVNAKARRDHAPLEQSAFHMFVCSLNKKVLMVMALLK